MSENKTAQMKKLEEKIVYVFQVRRTAFYLFCYIVVIETAFTAAYFALRFKGDLLRNLINLDTVIGWAQFLLVILNIFAISRLVFEWASTYYILRPGEVVLNKGGFNSRRVKYKVARVESLTIQQTLLGKIFNFGSIRIYSPVQKNIVRIKNIPDPEKYAQIYETSDDKEGLMLLRGRK